jgi:phage portal protein BeeE
MLASLGRALNGRASLENPGTPLTDTSLVEMFGGGTVEAGVPMSGAKALQLTSVYRAVSLIAGTCAGVPLHAYRTPPNGGVR